MYDSALLLSADIKAKKLSVKEVLDMYFQKIEQSELNTFVNLSKKQAYARAEVVQAKLSELGQLAGVPIGLKDNISTKGIETTCGSKMLEGYTPIFNAAIVDKLEAEGMIVIGKLNMDEFGAGNSSAEAVAAGEIPVSIASDGILQSCIACGVAGIKPTYGTVSRYGVLSSTSSLAQVGVIGKTIDDCAAVLGIKAAEGDCIKIGQVEEIDTPIMDYLQPCYQILACAEASSNLARYDGLQYGYRAKADTLAEVYKKTRGEGFGIDVKRSILLGSFVLSSDYYESYYKKAMQVRELVIKECDRIFQQYDVIISSDDVLSSLAGLPAVALPTGEQLIGPAFSEAKLLQAAKLVGGGKL